MNCQIIFHHNNLSITIMLLLLIIIITICQIVFGVDDQVACQGHLYKKQLVQLSPWSHLSPFSSSHITYKKQLVPHRPTPDSRCCSSTVTIFQGMSSSSTPIKQLCWLWMSFVRTRFLSKCKIWQLSRAIKICGYRCISCMRYRNQNMWIQMQ